MSRVNRIRATSLMCFIGIVLAGVPAADAGAAGTMPTYRVTVIGPFSRQGREGLAINSRGHVTGQGAGSQLFLSDGSLHLLGKPTGSQWAVGQGISDGDVIAATAQTNGVRRAYVVTYAGGRATWTALPRLQGFRQSEASAILPDGSAIASTLCATGVRACGQRRISLAVVWRRSAGRYLGPIVLPSGKVAVASSATGIARAGAITVVSGNSSTYGGEGGGGHGIWLLQAHRFLSLTGPAGYTGGSTFGIAHGSGNTFYVAGEVWRPELSVDTHGLVWTVTCTVSECRQVNRQMLSTFGGVFAVNSHGDAAGYSRPNGDGGGFNFVWKEGKMTTIDPTPLAINAAGEIAGWRPNYAERRLDVVLLTPSVEKPDLALRIDHRRRGLAQSLLDGSDGAHLAGRILPASGAQPLYGQSREKGWSVS